MGTAAIRLRCLVITGLIWSLEAREGTEGNLFNGKVLGMTDDGLMAYSSLSFGLFAAYQWRREAHISAWIAFAAVISYAEHLLRHELLTWLDRAAAVSLAIVLVRRIGSIPRRCHLAVALLLWATCDILYGNLSRPLYVSLHSLWHVSIWTYVAELPRE